MFGKGGENFLSESTYGSIYEALFSVNNGLINKIKKGNAIVVVSVNDELKFSKTKKGVDNDGETVEIKTSHSYSVVDADDKYVYLINPWDTSNVIRMTIEDFKDTFNRVDVLDIEE